MIREICLLSKDKRLVDSKLFSSKPYNGTLGFDKKWLYRNNSDSGLIALDKYVPVVNIDALGVFIADCRDDYSRFGFVKSGDKWFKCSREAIEAMR